MIPSRKPSEYANQQNIPNINSRAIILSVPLRKAITKSTNNYSILYIDNNIDVMPIYKSLGIEGVFGCDMCVLV